MTSTETVSNVTKLTSPELVSHIERCERLLRHPTLLSRLPDGGDSIRQRHTTYTAEQTRRAAGDSAASTQMGSSANGKGREASAERANENSEETFEAAARAIGEKYKNQRVPVEEIVRRTFGGTLNEDEIQRILLDVPSGFFLTHEETLAMHQRALMEERQRELEMLRNQMSQS